MTSLGVAVVTGASGFIGSALARRLGADGTRVICPVRAKSPRAARLAELPGVELVPLPAFDLDTLRRELRGVTCDAVFHLAAYGIAQGERDPLAMIEGNATLSASVLSAAADWAPRRFVFAGSNSEYAPAQAGVRVGEDHPLRPTTLYGAAKAAAHVYATTLALHLGVPFVGLRIFGTFGVGEAPERLIPAVIDHLARGAVPELTPGEHQRDLAYVDDVAWALVPPATHPGIVPGRAYNVCSGVPRRIADVARRVAALMGRPESELGLGRRPYRADEPEWLVGDPSRFREATGWQPQISLDEGIRRMIRGARN
jgi:nucleoside-diphosphate-sugar epimerase